MERSGRVRGFALRRGIASVAAWAAFVGAWLFVVQRPGAVLPTTQLLVIPASAVVVVLLSAYWVRHNRRIYQRKGPRRGIPSNAGLPAQDRLGRPVDLHLLGLLGVQEVVLETTSAGKAYRGAG